MNTSVISTPPRPRRLATSGRQNQPGGPVRREAHEREALSGDRPARRSAGPGFAAVRAARSASGALPPIEELPRFARSKRARRKQRRRLPTPPQARRATQDRLDRPCALFCSWPLGIQCALGFRVPARIGRCWLLCSLFVLSRTQGQNRMSDLPISQRAAASPPYLSGLNP